MIGHLNNLLRHLFLHQVPGFADPAQIGLQPPDEVWATYVKNLSVGNKPANALNVYLVDLRENRKLRSNERVRTAENGELIDEPAPARVDCHYLITAWSPALVSPQVEPTLDEHVLLYDVLAALVTNAPLNFSRIYPSGSPILTALPALIREADLPTQVAPAEGFPKLAEFWGTMGAGYRWKPAIYLVITLPVGLPKELVGPMVTTLITEYHQSGSFENPEIWIQIGGHVLDATQAPVNAVARAWVALETATGERLRTTETDEQGRFVFDDLRTGAYQLQARAPGLNPVTRPIQVPSPTGEYDVKLT